MNRAKTKHTRPSTVLLDESAFCNEQLSPNSTASPHIQPPTIQKMATAVITPGSMEPHPSRPNARIPQLNQNPWDTFEPAAGSSQDRSLIFARNKSEKGKLVHIQQLEKQFSPATGFLELMEQVAHPSFLKLLECYHHDASCTLIWEPTEVSVSHILASSCSITTDELVGIVKPVSQ
ncbi:hypothetical protein N7497_000874 [Penicillium chrysogenum]|nr:hypothetical protein N7497_000874 [Penicillium chrysogenum]